MVVLDMFSKAIKVAAWNIRGMCSYSRQSHARKVLLEEGLDALMLQENKLGQAQLNVRGYDCLTSKARRGSGGCMILVKKKFNAQDVLTTIDDCGRVVACKSLR